MAASATTPLTSASGELVGLNSVSVRHGFIQKVYGILGVQLVATTIIGGATMKLGEDLVRTNPALMMTLLFGSLAVSVAMMCVFMCCPDTMRRSPLNYVLLSAFTVAESIMVGFICIQYTQASVVVALGVTAFIVVSLSIFACQTSIDFTGMGPYLFCACLALMGFGFMLSIASMCGLSGPAFSTLRLFYAAGGAMLFSMYLVFDTQLIIGGKHKHSFSIDDYCMAAISLYIDIIQLFLYLLELFGDRR